MNSDSAKGIEIQSDRCLWIQKALVVLLVAFGGTSAVMAQEATLAYYTFDSEAEENQVRVVSGHLAAVSNHREVAHSFPQRSMSPAHSEAIGTDSQNENATRARRPLGVVNRDSVGQLGGSAMLRAVPERTRPRSDRWTRVEPVASRFSPPQATITKRASLGPTPQVRASSQDLIPLWRESPRTK